ncbi:MAG: hypothetical protein ABI388_12510 [Bacteroidia bacterium]
MKKILILIFLSNALLAQEKKQFDTLFFANKKYPIEQEEGKISIFNLPFGIVPFEYKYIYKQFKYYSMNEENCDCISKTWFDLEGNTTTVIKCQKISKKEYAIDNFLDSISVDFSDIKYPEIVIKSNDYKIRDIDKIQFKLIYDSTTVYLNWDHDQLYGSFFNKLRDEIKNDKQKVKMIIANAIFYRKGNTDYYLPAKFAITLQNN